MFDNSCLPVSKLLSLWLLLRPLKFFSLLIFLLIVPVTLHSQWKNKKTLPEPYAGKLREDSLRIYRKTLAKPFLKLENRNSFISSEPVDFYGVLLGATFWERHTIAAGYYFLDKNSRKPIAFDRIGYSSQHVLRFHYFKFAYQFVLLNRKYVQINVPVEIGAGSFYAKTSDTLGLRPTRHHGGVVIPYSGGTQFILKIRPWIGLSASGGYRHVQKKAELLNFNGFYYSYGVWVDARQVIRNYFYHRARKAYLKEAGYVHG